MFPPRRVGARHAACPAQALPALALLLATACTSGGAPATGDSASGATATATATPSDAVTPGAGDAMAGGVTEELCIGQSASVDGQRVGAVRLGMTAAELRRTCHVTDTTFTLGEGLTTRGLATRVVGASVVAELGAGDTVTRIFVREAGLLTDQQIGVTSNLLALRRRFQTLCPMVGEGRVLVASPQLPGVSFMLSADYGTYAGPAAAGRVSALPDTSSVTTMLVHGVSTTCEPG